MRSAAVRTKRAYIAPDGTPMVNVFLSGFPESLFVEVKDYQLSHDIQDFNKALIELTEKGLGKRG